MTLDHTGIKRVACIGEAMIELSPLSEGRAAMNIAGDVFNTAVYLRPSLPDTAIDFVTAVGDDQASDMILAAARNHGLGTGSIERRSGMSPGPYMIFTDDSGERSFSYWRAASAARTLFETSGKITLSVMDSYDLVYLSGITLAILSDPVRDALIEWASEYRKKGGRIAFDSNYRPALWCDRTDAQRVIERMWRQCDIALPSLGDENALFGAADEADVIDRLRDWGVTFGALKRGGLGPLALDGSGDLQQVTPVADVIDTTAAGDSFNAGLLAGLVAGKDTRGAMKQGHDLAARAIGHRGAIMPAAKTPSP
ncbi:sugar kinase [Halocynthiibacter sp. C4]|uniref:sugar kinase n=1 Tax=Halocynthiibacter sp. C4 TaxID=2992758 RepID=UPI00237A1A3A|nr:sugar kinase [Halocynthiibacter sp. C4]MDE0591478.1 sugar kinase [Halocynthiibacter sp. C4]